VQTIISTFVNQR